MKSTIVLSPTAQAETYPDTVTNQLYTPPLRVLLGFDQLRHRPVQLYAEERAWVLADFLQDLVTHYLDADQAEVFLTGSGAGFALGGPPSQRFDLTTYVYAPEDMQKSHYLFQQMATAVASRFYLDQVTVLSDDHGVTIELTPLVSWRLRFYPLNGIESHSEMDGFAVSLNDGGIYALDSENRVMQTMEDFDFATYRLTHRICEPHADLNGSDLLKTILAGMNCGAAFHVTDPQWTLLDAYMQRVSSEAFQSMYQEHVSKETESPQEQLLDMLNLLTLFQMRQHQGKLSPAMWGSKGLELLSERVMAPRAELIDLLQFVKGVLLSDCLVRGDNSPWIWSSPGMDGAPRSYLGLRVPGGRCRYLSLNRPDRAMTPVQVARACLESRAEVQNVEALAPLFEELGFSAEVSQVLLKRDLRHIFATSWQCPWMQVIKADQDPYFAELYKFLRGQNSHHGRYQESRYAMHCWLTQPRSQLVDIPVAVSAFVHRSLVFTAENAFKTDSLFSLMRELPSVCQCVKHLELGILTQHLSNIWKLVIDHQLRNGITFQSSEHVQVIVAGLCAMQQHGWITAEFARGRLHDMISHVQALAPEASWLAPFVQAFVSVRVSLGAFEPLVCLYRSLKAKTDQATAEAVFKPLLAIRRFRSAITAA